MVRVFKLGYVMFDVQNMDVMQRHYSEVLGLTLVEHEVDGSAYLSTSVDHHMKTSTSLTPDLGMRVSRKSPWFGKRMLASRGGVQFSVNHSSDKLIPEYRSQQRVGYVASYSLLRLVKYMKTPLKSG